MGMGTAPPHTPQACSNLERGADAHTLPEIRAYKLGKKRWSYNSVELRLVEAAGGGRTAAVAHASAAPVAEEGQDDGAAGVAYALTLQSGHKLRANVFLCHSQPEAVQPPPGAATSDAGKAYKWRLVGRHECRKGCSGPTLRPIKRFGRMGKQAKAAAAAAAAAEPSTADGSRPPSKRDFGHLWLSLDEACTHVDAPAFRLVAGVYDRRGARLLATAVSPPIRVLANNDVPQGAAQIVLEAEMPPDWEGWAAPADPSAPAAVAAAAQRTPGAPKRSKRPEGGTAAATAAVDAKRPRLLHAGSLGGEAPADGATGALLSSGAAVAAAMQSALDQLAAAAQQAEAPPPPALLQEQLQQVNGQLRQLNSLLQAIAAGAGAELQLPAQSGPRASPGQPPETPAAGDAAADTQQAQQGGGATPAAAAAAAATPVPSPFLAAGQRRLSSSLLPQLPSGSLAPALPILPLQQLTPAPAPHPASSMTPLLALALAVPGASPFGLSAQAEPAASSQELERQAQQLAERRAQLLAHLDASLALAGQRRGSDGSSASTAAVLPAPAAPPQQ